MIRDGSSAIVIVPATMAHATRIDLRDGDRREIAALGVTMPQALELSMSRALWADAYLIDGEVAALVGLSTNSLLGGIGSPWLFTGRPVDRHRKDFLRLTRAGVARMRAECPVLVNHVHADYRQAIRWLEWLGFTVAPPQLFGPLGAPFCRASIGEKVVIQAVPVAEIERAPNFPVLAAEYAAELLIDGMPPPSAKWAAYRQLEAQGLLHVLRATVGGTLVGFISVLASTLPRYGVPIACSESFFVTKTHRKTGAGLRLLRAAEDKAREAGSPLLLVSAPANGALAKVLPRAGYVETNRVFARKVGHG